MSFWNKEFNGFSWKAMLVDIHGKVKSISTDAIHTKNDLAEFKKQHKDHVEKEEKDWIILRNEMFSKIETLSCPLSEDIDKIKKIVEQSKGRKSAWSDMRVILALFFTGVGTITGFFLWLKYMFKGD